MAFKLTVKSDPVSIEFEAGSLKEAHAILTQEKAALDEIFADFGTGGEEEQSSEAAPAANGGRRKRRTKAEMEAARTAETAPPLAPAAAPPPPAPVNASAPPPIPVPAAAPPPPAPAGTGNSNTDGLEIPDYLKRPAAPPAPPPAPPAMTEMKDRVIAELRKRGPDIVAWLASPDWEGGAFVTKGADLDEALTVMKLQTDEKLKPIAAALGIA